MRVLFVHQNFPAQFQWIAPRLARDYGWDCAFVTEKAAGTLPGVTKVVYKAQGGATAANHPCTRNFENTIAHAHGVYEALKTRPDIQPDLVIAHTGFGSSLFLPFLYDAPIINFLEYYYDVIGQDLGYRPELPVTELDLLRVKAKNAMILLDLENCDRGWTPTHYQRAYFPPTYRDKIEVCFDGIDADIYHRRDNPQRRIGERQYVGPGKRIVTYVARGFEMMRGFDIFMKVARRIYEQDPDVVFVVVGADRVHYGGDLNYIPGNSFRHHVLAQEKYDLSKFRFVGFVPPETLAEILSISDLHIYLTQPFITSWSMVHAMGCGAVVLASDQPCVREYITPGVNGLLGDFFDVEGLARQALDVLRDPAAYRPMGAAARQLVADNYTVQGAMPRLVEFFTRVAAQKRAPSVRAELLTRPGTMPQVRPLDGVGVGPLAPPPATPTPAPVPPLPPGAVAALEPALTALRQLARGPRSIPDWIRACQEFRGPGIGPQGLGPRAHPTDLARLMKRVHEWNVGRALDLGTRAGGTLFLWTRVAADQARLIAAGLPGRSYPAGNAPFLQAMARDRQTIVCLPDAADPDDLARQVDQATAGQPLDFVFLDGRRPLDALRDDFQRYLRRVRRDGLIAWDGIEMILPPAPAEAGGHHLWAEVKALYPYRAEYLEGSVTPSGGIGLIRV